MSFWDNYKDLGGNYLKAAEKDVLMENGIPFTITAVTFDDHPQYGERYVASVIVPNPETSEDEERAISFPFGTVESRDRMLKQMMEYLENEGSEPVVVKLEKVGRSNILRQA